MSRYGYPTTMYGVGVDVLGPVTPTVLIDSPMVQSVVGGDSYVPESWDPLTHWSENIVIPAGAYKSNLEVKKALIQKVMAKHPELFDSTGKPKSKQHADVARQVAQAEVSEDTIPWIPIALGLGIAYAIFRRKQ